MNMNFNFDTNEVLLIIGAYGIIQVLAQDLGIKTGKKQRDLMQSMPVQIVLLFSGAYTIVNSYRDAAIATIIYYYLKYVYSNGETSAVCFEDV
jgi:Na+/H+ antiporter NhaD/arsenite permease-like protein